MNGWWWFVAGALIAGPLWVGATLWAYKRIWRNARRLSARAKSRDNLAELGQLTGGLAHEIKNPLSTINLNLKLLAEDVARHADETHQRWLRRLQNVQDEAGRLRGILDDFLHYAGRYELSLAVVDLRRLVGEVSDFFEPQAQAAHDILRTALSEQGICSNVDANLLKQALLNLMLNGVQAMPQGGELLVKVGAQRGSAVIEVIDTGTGIPPDRLRRVFEVYYSTKPHGTGLGLSTTQRIIREHDGDIRVESEVGKGTRFIITLRLAKADAVGKPPR